MSLITFREVSKHYANIPIFKNINFTIGNNDKVALIGKNGSGKSTIFRLITKADDYDAGEVILRNGLKIGLLEQYENVNLENTILDYIFLGQNEDKFITLKKYYELTFLDQNTNLEDIIDKMNSSGIWELEVNIKKILQNLKIFDINKKIGLLSGGEFKRVALAKTIINDFDILLLDEPTNHLDLEMIEWLEEYLNNQVKSLFVITHDRYFLDKVCNKILEIDTASIYKYEGTYDYYLEKKSEQEEINARNIQNAMTLYRKELVWMRRQPQGRQTKAKARIEAFYELKKRAFVSLKKQNLEIDFYTKRLGSKILELKNVSKSFGNKKILDNFNFLFSSSMKIGLVGKNGVGKSTLLDIISGSLKPDSGEISFGSTVELAYFRQDFKDFNSSKKIIEIASEIAQDVLLSNGQRVSVVKILDMFNFSPKIQNEKVSILSYGEKKRLYLITLLLRNPNFLILDEPTNDLDIFTLTKLEEFLSNFNGCIIVVSHDRYFLDKLVDHILVFEGEGEIKMFSGTYSEYKLLKSEELNNIPETQNENKVQISNKDKNRINKIEKELKDLEIKRSELYSKLNSQNINQEEIMHLSVEFGEVEQNISSLENEWLEIQGRY